MEICRPRSLPSFPTSVQRWAPAASLCKRQNQRERASVSFLPPRPSPPSASSTINLPASPASLWTVGHPSLPRVDAHPRRRPCSSNPHHSPAPQKFEGDRRGRGRGERRRLASSDPAGRVAGGRAPSSPVPLAGGPRLLASGSYCCC